MVGTDVQPPKRIQLRKEELELLSKEELIEKWLQQETYLDHLESSAGKNSAENLELVSLRESEEKLKQQQLEASRRENVLVMRLTTKEQEMQEYAHQIQELKGITGPGGSGSTQQLRAALLDPAVNLLFDRMKREVEATRARLQETQNELSAWKFTPDRCTQTLNTPSFDILVIHPRIVSTDLRAACSCGCRSKVLKVREGTARDYVARSTGTDMACMDMHCPCLAERDIMKTGYFSFLAKRDIFGRDWIQTLA